MLRHRCERHSNGGQVILFKRSDLLEDLASPACQCVYPECEAAAPGRSGRCRKHAAKGEPPVELVCEQCGERFTRHRSWLKERDGRGRFCSNACQFAWQRDNDERFAASHAPFDSTFADDYQGDIASAIESAGFYTAEQFADAHASAPSVIRADALAGVAPSQVAVYKDGQLLVGDAAFGVRGGTRRRVYPRSKSASDGYRRAILTNDHRVRYLSEEFMAAQQQRTVNRLVAKGLKRDQAEAVVRDAAKKRRKAIRRTGPRPSATPSPINVERAHAVEEARLQLQAEYEAAIRPKPASARAARLRASQNIAAHDPRLLPADYVAGGGLRPHYEDAAIALLVKAEKACKSA